MGLGSMLGAMAKAPLKLAGKAAGATKQAVTGHPLAAGKSLMPGGGKSKVGRSMSAPRRV